MSPTEGSFAYGVASFEPTSDSVLLWTHAGDAAEVDWVVATDTDLRHVVASGRAATSSGGPGGRDVGPVTVDVPGLEPATTYWYRFDAGSARSPVGRTRTLPASGAGVGVERFRILTVCCARYAVAPLGVYRAVAEAEGDLVLHLGDYIYEDDGSGGPRDHDPPEVATTLEDYRRRYAQIRSDTDAQALHAAHPVVAIWDDHDLADNAWRTGAKGHDPQVHGPWEDRVAAATKARQEWLPSRLPDPDDPRTTWRSVVVGDLAELVLLDTRFHGRDRQAGDDESPDLDDPRRSLLGEAQRAWLEERLADAARPWAIVASGVVVNELELDWPRPLRWIDRLLPNGYAVLDGRILHDDQWDGYPAEREWLVQRMASRVDAGGRTVILSGDVHSSWAFTGPCDRSGAPVAVELTTPAVSSAAMGRAHYPGLWRVLDRAANDLPHVEWADVTERGFASIDVTADAVTATFWFVHPYAADPAGDAVAAAAFRTRLEPHRRPALESIDPAPLERRRDHGVDSPPRPDDLRRLRWRRRLRLSSWPLAAMGAAAAGAASMAHRRRR